MPTSPALAALRDATSADHQSLDRLVDPVRRLRDPGNRLAAVHGYHAMHAAAEAGMESELAGVADLRFARRRRTPLVAVALRRLGGTPSPRPPPVRLADYGQAMGMLYVMEGATLGGRLILRDLAAAGVDPVGLEFLDPYGADAGGMWRDVLDALARLDSAQVAAAVTGATIGFAHARACLRERVFAGPPENS